MEPDPAEVAACIEEATWLCRQLAGPDIHAHNVPVYVLDHPPNLPRIPRTLGYANRNLYAARLVLERDNKWQGPGAVAVVDCSVAATISSPDPFAWNSLQRTVLAVAIHELAHLLPLRQPENDCARLSKYERVGLAYREAELTIAESAFLDVAKGEARHPCTFGHGLQFIRTAIHLHERAHRLGYRFAHDDRYFAGPDYGLSPAYCYAQALGTEPVEMVNATFDEILVAPAPREFRQLFQRDVKSWLRQKQLLAQAKETRYAIA